MPKPTTEEHDRGVAALREGGSRAQQDGGHPRRGLGEIVRLAVGEQGERETPWPVRSNYHAVERVLGPIVDCDTQ